MPGSESSVLTPTASISAATLSTPNFDGDVIHEVQPGQSLWQLAIAYEVKIEDIKRLNNLFDDNIYPGDKLLIKRAVHPPAASLPAVPGIEPSMTSTNPPVHQPATSSTAITFTSTEIAAWNTEASMPVDKKSSLYITIGIIVLALLAGGAITWLGNTKKPDK